MKLKQLIALSLQYLESDAEINSSEYDVEDLINNDVFGEYIKNIESPIYSAIARYTSSLILPIQEIELKNKMTKLEFTRITVKNDEDNSERILNVKEKIFKKIKEVYALDSDYKIVHNVPYVLIGSKLIITNFNSNYTYFAVYFPNVMYLDNYRDNSQDIYDVDLAYLKVVDDNLGEVYVNIPDEMAINIKYMVYSELKMEDFAALANNNKNYFEAYLAQCKNDAQTQNYQDELIGIDYGDRYGYKENNNDSEGYGGIDTYVRYVEENNNNGNGGD